MRIAFNANISPLAEEIGPGPNNILLPAGTNPNQLHQLDAGLEPSFMVYDQTVKRIPVWSDKNWNLLPANKADWTREIKSDDLNSPDYIRALEQCGWLALHADTYWPGMDRQLSVMLDLEAPTWSARNPSETDLAFCSRMFQIRASAIQSVGRFCGTNVTPEREGNQERTRVGLYGWPDSWAIRNFTPDTLAATSGWQQFIRWVDYFAPELYLWPDRLTERGWFDYADKTIRDCRRHAPWMPIIGVLCPLYQKRGDGLYPDRAKLDGQPIPPKMWKRMLQFLKSNGCEAYIWTPPMPTLSVEMARLYDIAGEVA
jgi:hypothetical protein